jgi:D-glycero-alpha-D-manno-heptose 1-phosphate guanylyltransferase
MANEVIILAGGFGTRLTSIEDIPKAMAPIDKVPFLEYLLNYLTYFNITKVHLAVGYKHEVIKKHFGNQFKGLELNYVIESEPLGTGGAIKKALKKVKSENVIVLNGDTFFEVDFESFDQFHTSNNADITLALKPMSDFDRYGTVSYDDDFRITSFAEKKYLNEGSINGGVYLMKTNIFNGIKFPENFSIEKDFFEKYYSEKKLMGFINEGYFIDIGIPTDYTKAQLELPKLFM